MKLKINNNHIDLTKVSLIKEEDNLLELFLNFGEKILIEKEYKVNLKPIVEFNVANIPLLVTERGLKENYHVELKHNFIFCYDKEEYKKQQEENEVKWQNLKQSILDNWNNV